MEPENQVRNPKFRKDGRTQPSIFKEMATSC